MLTTAQLVAILASMHGHEDAEARHWLGNMRRDGHLLAGDRPRGRGRPVAVGPGEAVLVAIAYELASHRMPPKAIGRIVDAMPEDSMPAIARIVVGEHEPRILLAVDGPVAVCSASDLVRWCEGRGSTRSAVVLNLARIVDDVRTAADDRNDAVPASFDADLARWARTILDEDRNA